MSLELREVSRRFGAQWALERLSLTVERGDCYGFLGHNGAGKTTAMRIVLGLVRPTSGRVLIDGFDAAEHPREAHARLGGLIEVPGFHGALDGATNLRMLARLQGFDRARAGAEARRALELVGLGQAGTKPVQAYSHGMRQRLGIAQALLGSPPFVLLDEPMSGLDPEGIAEVREVLRRAAREEGLTVMLSTHQLHEVEGLCNRVAVIARGRLVVEARTQDLFAGASARYAIGTDHDARAAIVLTGMGLAPVQAENGLELDLGARDPAEVSRTLVNAGLALKRFAPRAASLEEIYLRYTRGAREHAALENAASAPVATPATPAAPASAPAERRAPPRPTLAALRYELGRVFAARSAWLLLALPAALAVAAVVRRKLQVAASLEQVERKQLFSATDATAFEGVGVALSAALPLCALLFAGLASQSIAGELSRGTLRNLLLRPLLRREAASGKALAQALIALAGLALVLGAALAAAAACFDFRDVTEILPSGERYVLLPASELWPELARALASPILPLLAYAGVGLVAGAIARSAAGALGLAFGLVLFLDLVRAAARPLGFEAWLPSAYLPSPLGDTSFVRFYSDVAQGVSNSAFEFSATAVSVPVLWISLCFIVSAWVLERRSIS